MNFATSTIYDTVESGITNLLEVAEYLLPIVVIAGLSITLFFVAWRWFKGAVMGR